MNGVLGSRMRVRVAGLAVLLALALPVAAQDRVSDTPHNLSVSGPGVVRAQSEQQVCIFCHAPHNTGGLRPLWNREMPVASYTIYDSSTLDANPGQPTGASKLCLSCHDGTIAFGNVLNRADRIRMTGGDFLPAGLANLGTDLSDDHPISFHYTSGLAASDSQLLDPLALPLEVRLDESGQLQCTTCHDAHNNTHGDFLARDNRFGLLCTACHSMKGWSSGSHQSSSAAVSTATAADWPYATVAQNACRSCHRSHTAGGRERLLIFENEEDNCLDCHDGQVASTNILSELSKVSSHDVQRYLGSHDPTESLGSNSAHVECTDCHNPHAVSAPLLQPGFIPIGETLAVMPGVTTGGAPIAEAQYEYQICFRCHGDNAIAINRRIARLSETSNLRLRFSAGAASYHPVVTAVGHSDTVSLAPGIPFGTTIRCTDCHNNDTGPRAGGTGPDGPHGSNFDFLLERNYTVRDNTIESYSEFAMCYKCHLQSSILADQSFSEHRMHILEENAPCSACHDPHGVSLTGATGSDHTHLINFDTTIVRPHSQLGRIEFKDLGRFAGSCTLTCHGKDHDAEDYGP